MLAAVGTCCRPWQDSFLVKTEKPNKFYWLDMMPASMPMIRDLSWPDLPLPDRTLIACSYEGTGAHHSMVQVAFAKQPDLTTAWSDRPRMWTDYPDYPGPVPEQPARAIRLGTTPNDVLSLKLHLWAMIRITPLVDLGANLSAPTVAHL